jgi:tRNA(fMet)-specific endonuclease VapC
LVQKKASARLATQAKQILSAIDILPLKPPVDEHYGNIRAYLTQTSQPIGYNDLFIAAHARALNLILVTANVLDFSRVPELMVENWL